MAPTRPENQREIYGRTPYELANEFRLHAYELKLRGCDFDVYGGAIALPASSPLTALPPAGAQVGVRVIRAAAVSFQAVFVVFLAWLLLFNFSIVRGQSMQPGIRDGDRILIDRFSYMFGPIERGDIVVLGYPLDPNLDYIKRVIGVPGDQVQIRAGEVFVNGSAVTEPYVADLDRTSYFMAEVKEGHYFVLGDNRQHSSDSREFGQVPIELLKGKVEVRLWPPARLGILE
jgi:signal peptidase I